ncbi:MAG: ABC transporter ATP-binding protein, partial [Candidatus Electrothrix sp. ATG1]|nr:ABC transporter ATP-binding protein [Candidatus Electrothrix sp. ATG1]
MKNVVELFQMLKEVLSPRGRELFLRVVFFSTFASLADAVSVSLMGPFLAIATDFDFIHKNQITSGVYTYFDFQSEAKFVVALGTTVLVIYFCRAIISLVNTYLIARFSNGRFSYVATRLFAGYLRYPLVEYTKRNTGDLTKAVMSEASQITQVLSGVLTIATELLVFVLLYTIMLYTNWQGTLLVTGVLGTVAFLLLRSVSIRIKQAGIFRVQAGGKMFRALNTAFGNFRMLKLQGTEGESLAGFSNAIQDLSRHATRAGTLHQIPRLGLELAGFGLLIFSLILYIGLQETDIKNLLPVFSLFAVALYRLLPSVNRVVTSWNQIQAGVGSLRVVHQELHQSQEALGDQSVSFNKEIILEDVSFSYEAS